jgi:hypothetical protein
MTDVPDATDIMGGVGVTAGRQQGLGAGAGAGGCGAMAMAVCLLIWTLYRTFILVSRGF